MTVYSPTAGEFKRREEVKQLVRDTHSAFSDFQVTDNDQLMGDSMIMREWKMSGTREGEFMGAPATGREVKISGMSKVLTEDGKMTEEQVYNNPREMAKQRGVMGE